ncbi:MAG: exodeoxyribonuclease VII small subunit [Cyanobacteria bacterium HKST-UBA02]|nr:exodeoxyribonuclease VII small subunit [Cyanobacteria bacterium HKST-UBA02]
MKKERDFESTLMELEEVVQKLDGEVKLEAALELFERGMKLSRQCEEFLKGAEQKVEILKKNLDGSISSTPFDTDEESNDSEKSKSDDDEEEDSTPRSLEPRPRQAARSSSSQLSLPLGD